MPLSSVRALVAFVPLALTLGGCASAESDAAASTASKFVQLAATEPSAACDLLAPSTRQALEDEGDGDCAKGLQAADLPTGPTVQSAPESAPAEIDGHTSLVRLSSQVVFLSRFDDGWKVMAAGCRRTSDDPAVPYDCAVKEG